jgi:hypothetical protein
MSSPKLEHFSSLVDWEGVKEFNSATPPPTGRSIFDLCRSGITNRIVLGYSVGQIASELTKAAKLPSGAGIKEATLRTWLLRRGISARAARRDARGGIPPKILTTPSQPASPSFPNGNGDNRNRDIWSPTMTQEESEKAKRLAAELCADDDD